MTVSVEAIEQAVARGIRDAVSDPELWAAAAAAMQTRAQKAAGGFVLGGLRALATRIGWALVLLLSIYLLGGWSAVVAFFKSHPPA